MCQKKNSNKLHTRLARNSKVCQEKNRFSLEKLAPAQVGKISFGPVNLAEFYIGTGPKITNFHQK